MLDTLARILPYLLIAVLAGNLLQRGLTKPEQPPGAAAQPRPDSARRVATLLLAGVVLATWAAVLLLQRVRAPDWTGVPLVTLAIAATWCLRSRLKVFPLRCQWCGRRLPPGVTLGFDAAATARYEAGACPAAGCGAAPGSGGAAPDSGAASRAPER